MTRQKVDVIPASVRSVQNGGQLKSQSNIRVAAYCRVSTGDESQQTSYTTQKAFYKDLMFDNAYEQAVRLANNNSISVQRMATVENQIKEMEERLQDAISHQVAALREAALEQNVELNEALSNGEVTIDDIDLDIRSGLTPGSIGVSFYGTETEEGSEAQIYTELVNDLQERLKTLQQERQTIEEEQGVLAIMKKNFEYFLACLKELPDTNAGGMPLRVNGLDVQGSLLRDVDGKAAKGYTSICYVV